MLKTQVLPLEEVISAIQDSCSTDAESVATLEHMIYSGQLLFRPSGHPGATPSPRASHIVWPVEFKRCATIRSH